jgi:hypothetical protein
LWDAENIYGLTDGTSQYECDNAHNVHSVADCHISLKYVRRIIECLTRTRQSAYCYTATYSLPDCCRAHTDNELKLQRATDLEHSLKLCVHITTGAQSEAVCTHNNWSTVCVHITTGAQSVYT